MRIKDLINIGQQNHCAILVTGSCILGLIVWSMFTSCTASGIDSNQDNVGPETILDIKIFSVTESGATITWRTDEPSIGKVEYWLTEYSDRAAILNNQPATYHNHSLKSLQPDTLYHLQIESKGIGGNLTTSSILSIITIPTSYTRPEIGSRAPDFVLPSTDGSTVALSDYRNRLVMINFWAYSCSHCRSEMHYLQDVLNRWSNEDLAILAVHTKADAQIVREFVNSNNFTFHVLLDPDKYVYHDYKSSGYPVTFFVDGNGIIRQIKDGPFENTEEIEGILNSIEKHTGL